MPLRQQWAAAGTADVHASTYVFLAVINFAYFAQLIAVVGSGFLAQSIQRYFGGRNESTWLAQAIVIFTVALGPIFSQVADLWGRKWPTTLALLCGTVGSLVASRATSMGGVIAGYCITGVSFGSQPLLHAVVSEILPRRQRPLAQGSVNATAGIGAFIGICMGGALLRYNDLANFRIYLYVTAGIFAMAALGVALLYNPPRRKLQISLSVTEKLLRVDWIGNLLFAAGLVLFCVALSWSRNPYSWSSPRIIATFSIGLILVLGFFVYQWRFKTDGILNHGLFKQRNFTIAILAVFVEGLAFYAANGWFVFQISIFTHQDLLLSSLHFGLTFLVALLFAFLAGIYSSVTKSVKYPCTVGFALILVFNICMAATSNFNPGPAYWGFAVILGAGIGIILPLIMAVAQLSTPPELISTASALVISTRSLGGTVGLAISTALFNSALAKMPSNVAAATLPLGLPASSLETLIGALSSQNPQALAKIPGATPQIIGAAGEALVSSYGIGFRNCWIASAAFSTIAVVACLFLIDQKEELNESVDAPAVEFVAEGKDGIEAADLETQSKPQVSVIEDTRDYEIINTADVTNAKLPRPTKW